MVTWIVLLQIALTAAPEPSAAPDAGSAAHLRYRGLELLLAKLAADSA
jgi:hypothetical protein